MNSLNNTLESNNKSKSSIITRKTNSNINKSETYVIIPTQCLTKENYDLSKSFDIKDQGFNYESIFGDELSNENMKKLKFEYNNNINITEEIKNLDNNKNIFYVDVLDNELLLDNK